MSYIIDNIANKQPATYKGVECHEGNYCAVFTDAAGNDFTLSREDLYGCPAVQDDHPDPDLLQARQILGARLRTEFQRQLVRIDTPQVLHAQRLQDDIVRMTFHRYAAPLNKDAPGYVLLTAELGLVLQRTGKQMRFAFLKTPVQSGIPAAANHNMEILDYLLDPSIRLPKALKPYISRRFD